MCQTSMRDTTLDSTLIYRLGSASRNTDCTANIFTANIPRRIEFNCQMLQCFDISYLALVLCVEQSCLAQLSRLFMTIDGEQPCKGEDGVVIECTPIT